MYKLASTFFIVFVAQATLAQYLGVGDLCGGFAGPSEVRSSH